MTKEGYFTIIGVSSWLDDPGPLTRAVDTDSKCREVVGQGNADDFCVDPPNTDDSCIDLIDVGNYLTATVQIYDLTTGPASYAYNTTALADFRVNIVPNPGLGADDPPLLTNCQDGIDGLNYVLMKSSLVAFYDIEGLLGGHTDVVLTFPTKRQTLETIGAQNPFQGDQATATEIVPCDWTDMTHDPCEVIIVEQWDDEENLPGTTIGFSPSEPDERELCNEVNYIVVGESTSTPSLLDTDLKQFTIVQTGFDIGWINFVMTGTGRFISLPFDATSDMTSYGLPTIGYELGSFLEEYLTHMLPLRYKTTVQQTAAGG
ncbi:MAG TPA: hypothetical protein EYP19_06100 [Desulfobacterales bacterium]|nr:hypothetical protein [Desulfobacterales bacterium]